MRKLREIMRAGFLFVVQRDATVREAVQVMTDDNVGIVLVLEGERLVGVFSERDVVRRVVDRGLDPDLTPVGDVMTTQIVVGDPDEDYQSAMRKMDQANIRHLLVVKGPRDALDALDPRPDPGGHAGQGRRDPLPAGVPLPGAPGIGAADGPRLAPRPEDLAPLGEDLRPLAARFHQPAEDCVRRRLITERDERADRPHERAPL